MTFQSYQSLTQYTSLGNAEIRTPVGSNRSNEEPSVLGCSTGPGYKARPFLTEQKSFEINRKNPVPPPSGDAPLIGPILLVVVVSSISRIHKHEFHLKCTGIELNNIVLLRYSWRKSTLQPGHRCNHFGTIPTQKNPTKIRSASEQ